MKNKHIQLVMTIGFNLMQLFWIVCFFLRGAVGYYFFWINWNETTQPLMTIGVYTYELIWVGILPFIILCLTKRLLTRMLNQQLFTEKSYQMSLAIFLLTAVLPVASLLEDIFYYQKPYQDMLTLMDSYLLPYMGSLVLLLVLLVLVLVIKNGTRLQEDVDGII